MATITIELEVAHAQELASTARTTIKKIDWVLENKPPRKQTDVIGLDLRAKILTLAATKIETALHQRALSNVVKIGEKQ